MDKTMNPKLIIQIINGKNNLTDMTLGLRVGQQMK